MAELPLLIGQFQWEKRSRRSEEHRHFPGWASRVHTEGGTWAACGQEGFKKEPGVSLVAQWLRICLPMQGTRVRALVWEDPTCRGAAGPVSHNY